MIRYEHSEDGMNPVVDGEYVTHDDVNDMVEDFEAKIAELEEDWNKCNAALEERQERCDELEKALRAIRDAADV